MPLRIALVNRNFCPVVYCDHCRLPIESASEGNYQWVALEKDGQEQAVFFTHKRCLLAFEKARGGLWGAEELEFLPKLLINNLGIYREDNLRRFVNSIRFGLFGR